MPLNRWGRADAKSVSHLWNELQAGECQLLDGPPLRVVTIATVWVRWEWRCLFEIAQEWADGRTRARQSPPSDKMHRGEPLRDAVLRCLWEELGVPAEDVTILDQPPLVRVVERESTSYPGLLCRYTSYHVTVNVANLPDVPFRTAERSPAPSDPVRFHDWAWRPCDHSEPAPPVRSRRPTPSRSE